MKVVSKAILLLLLSVVSSLSLAAQTADLPPDWELRKTIESWAAQVRRYEGVLDQLQPKAWVENGAPEAYIAQWKSSRDELTYFLQTSEKLARDPERLTLAIEAYFRLDSLTDRLLSLTEGVRRYQNPAIGDLLQSLVNENTAVRDQVQQYMTTLASAREKEFEIIDREAQRCRASLISQPAGKAVRK